ncbi:MAG: FAD-dependent oxidoreductase [Candidatus Competibacteraceae bacterium]|nr:FAD-dependent oxidoreductase [Candidatus Competibacteraceae bacterium]
MSASRAAAVVVGVEVNGLGVLRSLALGDVPLIAADANPRQPAMRTRHGRKLGLRALTGSELVEDLLALARSLDQRPVLFLTRDDTVKTISAHRETLAPHYRFQLPPPAITTALNTKAGFQALAQQGNFPVPPGVHVTGEADLPKLAALPYPCALKPGERNAAYDRQFAKAYRIDSFAEAKDLCQRILPVMPDLLLQQWIEGSDDALYFVLQYHPGGGRPPLSFTGRKIRSWPACIGVAARCGPAPEMAAELEPVTTRFFQSCQLEGWAAMEYKRDARDGRFVMIEPSAGRSEMLGEIATLNGTNLALAAYHWLIGEEPPPPAARSRTLWRRDWLADTAAARAQPEIGLWSSADAPVMDGFWRRDDPLPALYAYPHRALGAVWRRLTGRS